jgi:hypothetical protein
VVEVEKGNTAKEDRQPDFVNFFSSEKTRKYFADIETEPDKLTLATRNRCDAADFAPSSQRILLAYQTIERCSFRIHMVFFSY